jgi:tetratricopeptide (TPR) repeat protein
MRAAGLLVALLLLPVATADAQTRDRRHAAARFQAGSALYAEGRWAEALAEFESGYLAYPLRGFLVNIGQCYRKLDRLEEAADTWRRYLATNPPDNRLRGEVEDALAEVETLQKKLAATAAPPPAMVTSAPPPNDTANLDAPQPALPQLALGAAPDAGAAKKKSRRWVWAVVGVAVASVAAAAITVGVVEWQNSSPQSGSLGLIDGRR